MFVAIRHNWSAAYGHWEIQPREYASLAEAKEELCHGMLECSEHCRGVEIKRVKYLPTKWLQEQMEGHRDRVHYHDYMRARFERMLAARKKK